MNKHQKQKQEAFEKSQEKRLKNASKHYKEIFLYLFKEKKTLKLEKR